MFRLQLFYLITLLFLAGCQEGAKKEGVIASPSFYHWKTNFNPTAYELGILQQNHVQNICLRFFDVAWDATYSKPTPVAQVRIVDTAIISSRQVHIIPTVFITNECIRYIRPEQCKALAENIHQLISSIITVNTIDSVPEIQIDCDWTAATKEKYFSILSELQRLDSIHVYSATIRLFQVKYKDAAGIPPVKKGLLMCYNMGNLKDPATRNSILDPVDLQKYTGSLQDYPLPLDVALPMFSWYVLFRGNTYKGLLQSPGIDSIRPVLKEIAKNRFEVQKDTSWNNIVFKKGDLLRYENSSFEDIIKAAGIIREKLNNRQPRLSLYHLDSITLSKYSAHEMEAIFRSLD